ncbi:hypothetical protein C8J56DRAFT_1020013 [Mycena floridula]|nr:hypothetical protein C8J56DRAFT_1020013 [Mycena floridula]
MTQFLPGSPFKLSPPSTEQVLGRFHLTSAATSISHHVCPIGLTFEVQVTSKSLHLFENHAQGQTPILQKPICLMPVDNFAYRFTHWVLIAKRDNVHDDFELHMAFESETSALDFEKLLKDVSAATPRRLQTKLYLVSKDTSMAHLIDSTIESHKSLLDVVSECLTAFGYGGRADILAPVALRNWDLASEPSEFDVKNLENSFRQKLPPIFLISDYKPGTSMANMFLLEEPTEIISSAVFPRAPSNFHSPLLPAVDTVNGKQCEVAIRNFGHHVRSGSHRSLKPPRLYISRSLVDLYLAVFDHSQVEPLHRASLAAVTAAMKITVSHEFGHYLVSQARPHGSPSRIQAQGGMDQSFNNCVVKEGILEAGLVIEKLWMKRHYGLAIDEDEMIRLYFQADDQDPPSPSLSSQPDSPDGNGFFLPQSDLAEESDDVVSSQEDEEALLDINGLSLVWLEDPALTTLFLNDGLPLFPGKPPTPQVHQRRTVHLRSSPNQQTLNHIIVLPHLPVKSASCDLAPPPAIPEQQTYIPKTPPTPTRLSRERRLINDGSAIKARFTCFTIP